MSSAGGNVVEDERRREIGLFRYALIRPAVEPGLSKAERGRLVRALAEGEHLGPGRTARSGWPLDAG